MLQTRALHSFMILNFVFPSYSSVPNNRIGPNKRTGWNFDQNTREQGKNWQFY